LLIVADGVGGWAEHGVDSGRYSKSLVTIIKQKFDYNNARELRKLLVEAA
jgi:serine/threonine protein phosphatase PrpC